MAFQLIDLENWERREFYEHFIKEVVCTYSVVVNIDITNLKGKKLYPAMIWLLTKTVNDMPEFRTSLTPEGLGIYDDMHPMYTVFNKENKNFSGIWAYFSEDYKTFLKDYEDDVQKYSTSTRYAPKEGTPANSFNISMVPWVEFTNFNINVFDDGKFLLPIFTMGKYFEREGKRLLPLAIQVHHAVCDGSPTSATGFVFFARDTWHKYNTEIYKFQLHSTFSIRFCCGTIAENPNARGCGNGR